MRAPVIVLNLGGPLAARALNAWRKRSVLRPWVFRQFNFVDYALLGLWVCTVQPLRLPIGWKIGVWTIWLLTVISSRDYAVLTSYSCYWRLTGLLI